MTPFLWCWEIWNRLSVLLLVIGGYAFLIPTIWRRHLEPKSVPKFRKVLFICGGLVIAGHLLFPAVSQLLYPTQEYANLVLRNTLLESGMLGLVLFLTQRSLKKLPAKELARRQEKQENA